MKTFPKKIWGWWLRFAVFSGNVQMAVFLTLLYWVFLPFLAIPFKFLSDPLSLKPSGRGGWLLRQTRSGNLEDMEKQG